MDENKIKELWKSTNEKLEESLLLNRKNTEDITRIKVQGFLNSMKPIKVFALLVGIVWVGSGVVVLTHLSVYAFAEVSKFFLFSAGIQVLLTAIAVVIYLYQLILIHQVDISEPILTAQERLASLKSSTLWVTRILFLQIPVWSTFYLSESMIKSGNIVYLIVNGMITLLFTYLTLWFFFNIKLENRDKKWFKFIFDGKEWTPLIKSMELLDQINWYKSE